MKIRNLALLLTLSSAITLANEIKMPISNNIVLTIMYEEHVLYIESSGKVKHNILDLAKPLSPDGGRAIKDSLICQITPEIYQTIFNRIKTIAESIPISGQTRNANDYDFIGSGSIYLQLGYEPLLTLSYRGAKRGEKWPDQIQQLIFQLNQLGLFNKALKAQPSAAGTPQCGAP